MGARARVGGHGCRVTRVRVAFDEQIFLLQQQGGVSRYFVELLRHLPELDPPVDVATPFNRVVNRHALEVFGGSRFAPARGPLQPYPQLAAAAARTRRRERVDLVHHTFYHPRFLRDYPGRPKVVTIYDMIPEVMGARGRFGSPHMAKQEYVSRADLLLFISESAREDLISAYGTPTAPSAITHLGVDGRFLEGGPTPAGFPSEYILFVGNRAGYKDFATLVRCFSHARNDLREMHLVCVGGGPLTSDEMTDTSAAGLGGRIHQFSLADEQMPGAYANAAAFVFPSRYEGFGLPALEAMAAGTPTLLARTSSLPEVGGDAALYFTPGDAESLASALVSLLGDPMRRANLNQLGKERALRFTWSRTAELTANAYRLVAD